MRYPFTLAWGDTRGTAVRLLNALLAGSSKGPVNHAVIVGDAFDDKTRAALLELQHKFGVPATGEFDASTQHVLMERAGIDFQKVHDTFYDIPLAALTTGTIAQDAPRTAAGRARGK